MVPIQVYENNVVANLPISNTFKVSLSDIAIRDYGKDYGLSKQVSAVDVDAYETSLSGNNDKTVDSAIGIANYINNSIKSPRLLLVELRLDYKKKAKNSSISSMLRKEAHSRQLLSFASLDKRCFFVFDTDVAPHKRSEIANQKHANSLLANWQVLSPKDFIKQFYFTADLPYTPITNINAIIQQGNMFLGNQEWKKLIDLLTYWNKQAEKYSFSNDKEEARAIFNAIYTLFISIDANNLFHVSDEIQLNYMVLEEDINKMKGYLC